MKTFLLFVTTLFISNNIMLGQDSFEPNNSSSEATPLNCNNSYNAYIQSVGDIDWYSVELDHPGTLSVSLNSVPANLDLNLEIYQLHNNQLKLIADDDDDNSNGGQNLVATAFINSGRYLILIADENSNGANDTEPYSFSLSCSENMLEINQTIELAASIPQDTCFEDNIWGENEIYFNSNEGDDDQDWFKVTITETGQLKALLNSVPATLDLNLEIYTIENNQPKRIADDDDENANGGQELIATAFINPGTYYIHIEDENQNSTIEESYNFCLSFSANKLEVNQTIELAASIPQDTCFEDNIWGENECYFNTNEGDNDQDWFQVQINESGYLNATLTSVPSILDLNLEIYIIENNQAKRIADDNDNNANGGQELVATAFINPGTYYIYIEDENNNTTIEETYNFCLSFSPKDLEINQTIELAALIPQDTCFEENIWGENECYFNSNEGDDDQEWYQINVDEKCLLTIDVTEVPLQLDLNLEIYQITNGQPVLIANDGDSNANGGQELDIELTVEPGTYYIHIEDENFNTTIEERFNFCISCQNMVHTKELERPDISVYPNPTNGPISIQGFEQKLPYQLINLNGQVINQAIMTAGDIDLTALEAGVYFLVFHYEDRLISNKIIKN